MAKPSAKTRRSPRGTSGRSAPREAADDTRPIVGVGASAGGLDAFKKLFSAMPSDSGLAFVLIPHLDPTHQSLMVELLSKQTAMPVFEARDGMFVDADHVYVIPPNADLTIARRVLHVELPPPHRGARTAIDVFLRSLAADQQERAIGVILSGTGGHGTLGLKEIKAAGGLVLAQAPGSAEHDQMPRSAIAAGVVDHVLPPGEMPAVLVRHAALLSNTAATLTAEDLGPILQVLRAGTKRDFRGYRTNMLLRRVRRRMGFCRIDRVAAYVDHLRAHPDEVQALGRDLSISVTAFFRDPEAFAVLERLVIPDLVRLGARAGADERPVRVWVPGCATGEEAYSIAMLFLEQFAAARQAVALQVFATDVDDAALDVARTGRYPDTIAVDVPADRLRQFFVKAGPHHFQVTKALREVITFAPQNLTGDAPFSKLDLIACRNVLIYLKPEVQAKIVGLFHFALVDNGYLALGPAESIGAATDRFESVSRKSRVYRRIGSRRRDAVDVPILPAEAGRVRVAHRGDAPRPPAAVGDLLHRALLADFAPAAVLVNGRFQILSVQGPVVDYLEFPPGELTRDLLSMARSGLRTAIRAVCERARQGQHAVADADARVRRQGQYVPCTVTARPVADAGAADGLLLVTFQDRAARRTSVAKPPEQPAARRRAGDVTLVQQLEYELKATREDLQGTITELETANEDLKASHEEVMSMNEELQSTNEEMETSKEELQSLNEELSTVNSQLQDKVQELDGAGNDMMNLLASTEIATVFLDVDLGIKRFTPPTTRLLNLLSTDLGRPFRDIAPRVADPALLEDCGRVIAELAPVEAVVRTDGAHAYLRRVLPYRTADSRIDGVVITWVDITQRLAAEAESRRLSAVLRDSNDAVALFDLDGRVIGWNRGAERLYGYTETEARAMRMRDLVPEGHEDAGADLMRRITGGEVVSASVDTTRRTKDGGARDVWLTMTILRGTAGQLDAVVTTERDVTELKEGLAAKQAALLYQQVIERLPAGAVLREGDRITMNLAAEAITGHARGEILTVDAWCEALHGDRAREMRAAYEIRRSSDGLAQPVPLRIARKDGQARHMDATICRLDATHDLWMLLDRTDQDLAQRALQRSEDYLRSIVNAAVDGIVTFDDRGVIDTFNPAAERMFGFAAADVIGRNIRLLMPEPPTDGPDGPIARPLPAGATRGTGRGREVTGLRKDGTAFPLELAVSEIAGLPRFAGILRDLSDRRKLEWRLAESQMEERRHMARELHDEIGGHMTGIGLLAQTIQSELAAAESPLAPRTQDLVRNISDAHQRLRSVIRGLMPVEAIPEGLMAALKHLAELCELVSGIGCRFRCEPPVQVDDPGTALHLFRIAQEAVNNAVRHGHPSEITITLGQTARRLDIAVTDDGGGMKEVANGHSGVGLESMRQRARLLGGDISIQPRDGGGTVVACWMPVP